MNFIQLTPSSLPVLELSFYVKKACAFVIIIKRSSGAYCMYKDSDSMKAGQHVTKISTHSKSSFPFVY